MKGEENENMRLCGTGLFAIRQDKMSNSYALTPLRFQTLAAPNRTRSWASRALARGGRRQNSAPPPKEATAWQFSIGNGFDLLQQAGKIGQDETHPGSGDAMMSNVGRHMFVMRLSRLVGRAEILSIPAPGVAVHKPPCAAATSRKFPSSG